MNRRGLWAVCVVLILLVVGAGVLTVGTVYAKDENAKDGDAGAKCSEATLHGRYLFAYDGVDITGKQQGPFAVAGYQVSNGNGKLNGVASVNLNGQIARKQTFSGTYTVKADCTSTITLTDGTQFDQFVAPDGSMLTFVQTNAPELVASGFALQGTAKRVGE
jgi:hypothetical protein